MNTKEIIEGNKLIAEFMGFTFTDRLNIPKEFNNDDYPYSVLIFIDEVRESSGKKPNSINSLRFHSSWDWLMPVVEKIENGLDWKWEVKIENDLYSHNINYICTIQDDGNSIKIMIENKSKIIAVFTAIVEFIKTYKLFYYV